jgi:5-hydroxyisourate hydrolase
MNRLTTHILDIARGLPAPGVAVRLEKSEASAWVLVCETSTDDDGRARLAGPDESLEMGDYRLSFEVEEYFSLQDIETFYPIVQVIFRVSEARHYHVPLLLSPFGFSTYRGS